MDLIPLNTLASTEALPHKQAINTGERQLIHVANATKVYFKALTETAKPDIRAVEFYAANHCYSLLFKRFSLNEPLPAWAQTLANAYRDVLVEQSQRMFHYLVLITTREARHLKTYDKHKEAFTKTYGQAFSEFIGKILGHGEMSAVDMLMDTPPAMTASRYFRGIEYLFNVGWGSGSTSFGGKNWAAVTKPLADVVDGKISLETMVDIGYTLAHNNGPIFNKGMMYKNYDSPFIKLLDIQRAGMIPELVLNCDKYPDLKYAVSGGAKQLVTLAHKNMPGEFEQDIDWNKVKEFSVTKTKHLYKDLVKAAPADTTLPFMGGQAKVVGEYEVYPEETVKVMERVK